MLLLRLRRCCVFTSRPRAAAASHLRFASSGASEPVAPRERGASDPYAYLQDLGDPRTRSVLLAEAEYLESVTACSGFQRTAAALLRASADS